MSKMGNHRMEVQQSDAYRWGWDWAEMGMALHEWMLPHLGTTQSKYAQQGWDDYHAHERGEA